MNIFNTLLLQKIVIPLNRAAASCPTCTELAKMIQSDTFIQTSLLPLEHRGSVKTTT